MLEGRWEIILLFFCWNRFQNHQCVACCSTYQILACIPLWHFVALPLWENTTSSLNSTLSILFSFLFSLSHAFLLYSCSSLRLHLTFCFNFSFHRISQQRLLNIYIFSLFSSFKPPFSMFSFVSYLSKSMLNYTTHRTELRFLGHKNVNARYTYIFVKQDIVKLKKKKTCPH